MKTLIVVATRAEIAPLIAHFKLPEGNFLPNENFDVLITGVGMTATAFELGRHLSKKYNLVVNLGIAGCFNRKIPLGTLINITTDQFAELGAENGSEFIPIDDLGFGKSKYSATTGLQHDSVNNLISGFGITVNTIHGDNKSIQEIVNRLSPLTESMEGAAVFYCCEWQEVPCIQIRSISNYVELRNRENWQIGLAITNINQWAISFLTNA